MMELIVFDKFGEFKIKLIRKGDDYGLNDCLINTGDCLIEFYLKTKKEFYFVSRYCLDTIKEVDSGLCLYGGGLYDDSISISSFGIDKINDWLGDNDE